MMNKNENNDGQQQQQTNMNNNDYVYRTSNGYMPPPIYNDVTPLIADNRFNNNNSYDNNNIYRRNILNLRPEYIYVFHSEGSRRRRLINLFLYVAMILLLTGLFIMFMSLFITYSQNYKYLLFVRRWPPTVCHGTDVCRRDVRQYNRWVIHGLWPENNDNTWDQFCSNQPLNQTLLLPIRENMLNIWPNLLENKTEYSLWKHEWLKHGTCSQMKQFDYFNQTLNLNNEFNLDKILLDSNIVPRSNEKYLREKFEYALRESIIRKGYPNENHNYVLNCKNHNNESYLEEIWLCVSFHHLDQPSYCTMQSSCPDSFYYIGF
ncbi:uncharacterized protein LOC113792425 [Dermatophagoides pteronyssinus]|uniref:uncharacterized protein LOC113792425 n=1 Tax=Dermatophagoides pteronyssinus TaxID=6956 RepID=UPI003F681EC0